MLHIGAGNTRNSPLADASGVHQQVMQPSASLAEMELVSKLRRDRASIASFSQLLYRHIKFGLHSCIVRLHHLLMQPTSLAAAAQHLLMQPSCSLELSKHCCSMRNSAVANSAECNRAATQVNTCRCSPHAHCLPSRKCKYKLQYYDW